MVLISFLSSSQKQIEFIEYDLDNGIHVIIHEEHATPIVAVSVMYHVGSKNENPERTGFAHFFEHLLFEGSENIGRGEYSDLVERNGGTLNANTSQDRTYYFELLPSNQLELGMWLESERLLHAKVDSLGIETQRSVVKEEKRQRVDNQPYGSFMENTFKRAFTEHSYNWVPIGSMAHLDAAEEKDYVNFYKDFYLPANATLSIAGDLDVAQTKKWVDKYFGSIPKGMAINLYRDYLNLDDADFEKTYNISKDKFNKNKKFKPRGCKAKKIYNAQSNNPTIVKRTKKDQSNLKGVVKETIEDNIQLPALFVSYKLPCQTHEDTYALDMLNQVLSGGSSSRINKSIVEKQELAMFAFSFNYGLEDAGLGIMAAIAAQGVSLDTIQQEFDKQIQMVKENLITEKEFEKIRNQYENQFVSSNSTIAGICENLANYHVYYGSANKVNTELNEYLKVTREDIKRVANKYYNQNARIILHYVPKAK